MAKFGRYLMAGVLLVAAGLGPGSKDARAEVQVLVAAHDLPKGAFLKGDDLLWRPWPEGTLPATALVEGRVEMADVYGSALLADLTAEDPIIRASIVAPGAPGFIDAALSPGYRAFTIKLSATSGIAESILPGDRVDLMMTHKVKTGEKGQKVTGAILQNVRILALDQMVNDRKDRAKVRKTATLEVTRKQAEMLAVLEQLGTLSLSLVSPRADIEADGTYDARFFNIICAAIPAVPASENSGEVLLRSPCGNLIPAPRGGVPGE